MRDQYETIGLGDTTQPEFLSIYAPWLSGLWEDFVDGVAHAQTTLTAPLLMLDASCRHEIVSMMEGYHKGLVDGLAHEGEVQIGEEEDERYQVVDDWNVGQLVPPRASEFDDEHFEGEPILHGGVTHYFRVIGLEKYFSKILLPARIHHAEGMRQMEPTLRYIRQAAILRAWSSLEAFTQDVWVTALDNLHPNLRAKCFGGFRNKDGLQSMEGLDAKSISLDLLSEHGFDLRNKMGTVLQNKCSFKTVKGINKAYKTAFGWAGKDTPQLQETKRLGTVETKRHCIVHRGGTVDDVTASKLKDERFAIGSPLDWTTEEAHEDLKLVLQRGLALARGVHFLLRNAVGDEEDNVEADSW